MIRILIFKNDNLGDLMPVLDGPEYLTTRLGDKVFMLNGTWTLVEVLTSGLTN